MTERRGVGEEARGPNGVEIRQGLVATFYSPCDRKSVLGGFTGEVIWSALTTKP